ncbi:MAG TPA: ABC transporter substrate-binding protein [Acidimicrobiales bacterium]|nr:ABC transporter substrate-binding protein [Acidimicrobiales bacterium]
MADELDRRSFLSRGAKLLGGAAVLGSGGGFLAACGSSSPSGGSTTGTTGTPGVSKGTPKKGGSLTIGVEAEDNGFNPTIASWDVTGLMYGAALFDTLAYADQQGHVKPYLAQSITPNADYTKWTITMRPNVLFHDGTTCDGPAVAASLKANKTSPQNGFALIPVTDISATDAMTVVVTTNEPWIAFPYYLTGSIGTVMAPAMLKAPNGGNDKPIGTGPFVFQSWVPNDHMTATRNPHYWNSPYPYLDQVTFKPIPDHLARENALRAGNIDIMHTDDTQTAVDFMHNASFSYINDLSNTAVEHEQDFFMINCAKAPLDDVRVRQALAYSIDRQKVINTLYNGISPNATGPYSKGSPYYTDTGYPSYNLSKAKSLIQQVSAEKGPVSFELSIINDAKDLAVTTLVGSMFQAAGAKVNIIQVEQSQYIVQALLGNYGVRGWRQFAASDPDENYVWWSSKTSAPIGSLSLNFARNKDPKIDAALETGRTSTDQNARIEAYQSISKQFAQDVPYLWINQAYWSVVAKPTVQDFNKVTLPDGSRGLEMTGGFINPKFIWVS